MEDHYIIGERQLFWERVLLILLWILNVAGWGLFAYLQWFH